MAPLYVLIHDNGMIRLEDSKQEVERIVSEQKDKGRPWTVDYIGVTNNEAERIKRELEHRIL